jgi:hypothetical protein
MKPPTGERRVPRIVRVRRLAKALHLVLKPTDHYLPVIPEAARKKIEYIAFGLDPALNREARDALAAFEAVEQIEDARKDGASSVRAWVLQSRIPVELDAMSAALAPDDASSPPGDTE